MHKTFSLFLVGIAPLLAQGPFGFGLKAGVPLNDALTADCGAAISYIENTHRYVIGPFVEVRLPSRFSVEVDALYRSYDYSQPPGDFLVPRSVSSGTWEFPVLARKALLGGPIQPYIEGGVALSHLSVNDVIELNHRNNYGIVLGAGVSFHLGLFRVAPEIRYNGWAFKGFDSPTGLLQSNRNQMSILVGIGF
ncbi:MAG: PorT family protein [Acidobacteriota bacterium]|nr:PorT family protein [Acidobacteriota bacterium]